MKLRHLSFAALALIAASCTNDNEPGTAGIDLTGQPMRVTTDVLPQTRAGMDDNNLTTFYLRVTNGSAEATTSYDEFTTVNRIDVNSSWTYNPELTWQDGTTPISVSALCQDGVAWDKTAYTAGKAIDISDQTEAGIQTADVLYMAPTIIDPAKDLTEDGAIPVKLSHLFAKLNITIEMETAEATNPITELTVGGTQATATLTPEATSPLTLTGEATDITAYDNGDYQAGSLTGDPATVTYECILLPQTATFTVTATIGGQAYTYVSSSPQQFVGNTPYSLTLKVDGLGYKLTVSDDITVGDWDNEVDLGNGDMNEDPGYTIAEDGTYQVYNADGLMAWATAVQINSSINCTLMANIDMKGQRLEVILRYTGTFDGQGHTISNLSGVSHGLTCDNEGTIQNVTLFNPNLNNEGYDSGGITSINKGRITNCHVIEGKVQGWSVGGIANYNSGSILACSSTADVIHGEAGGIVGYLSGGTVTACYYANGSVTGYNSNVGSIVGQVLSGTVSDCYWSGGAEKGIGEGTGEATKVTDEEGNTWAAAADAMNAALQEANYTEYHWVVNTGEDAASRPLITVKVTE